MRPGDTDVRPLCELAGVRSVPLEFDAGGGILTGSGNSDPLSFFLLDLLKKVVVVEIT